MSWKDEIKKQFHQNENGDWLFTEIGGDYEYTAPFKEMTKSAIERFKNFIDGYEVIVKILEDSKYGSSVYIENRLYMINLVFAETKVMTKQLMKFYLDIYKKHIIPEEILVDFRIAHQPIEEYINEIAMPALDEIKMHMEDIDYIEDGLKELEEKESSEDISLDSIIFAKKLQRRKCNDHEE